MATVHSRKENISLIKLPPRNSTKKINCNWSRVYLIKKKLLVKYRIKYVSAIWYNITDTVLVFDNINIDNQETVLAIKCNIQKK